MKAVSVTGTAFFLSADNSLSLPLIPCSLYRNPSVGRMNAVCTNRLSEKVYSLYNGYSEWIYLGINVQGKPLNFSPP